MINNKQIQRRKHYYSFLWLSLVVLLVFMLQNIFSGFTDLFILNENALHGEIWRFVTAIFLHGSTTHLLYNLFALLLFGLILETTIGTRNFLFVFFGSGILANVIGVLFYPGGSLGASGAIYGILGCLTILRPTMMVWVFGMVMPMFIAAIIWVIGDIIGLFIPDNVGHVAHLLGIVVGIIVGIALRQKSVRAYKRQKVEINEGYMKQWENNFMR